MRTLVQRVVVTILSTIFLAAAGALGGYMLGRAFALRQAEARLDFDANRILLEDVTSSSESHAILATMNTSPYGFCSDPEIEYFQAAHLSIAILEGCRSYAGWKDRMHYDVRTKRVGRSAKHACDDLAGWNKNL